MRPHLEYSIQFWISQYKKKFWTSESNSEKNLVLQAGAGAFARETQTAYNDKRLNNEGNQKMEEVGKGDYTVSISEGF